MGETIIDNSKSEKHLGDQIQEDRTAASINETLNKRILIANGGKKLLIYATSMLNRI